MWHCFLTGNLVINDGLTTKLQYRKKTGVIYGFSLYDEMWGAPFFSMSVPISINGKDHALRRVNELILSVKK
jgi:hypothetical protein